MKKWENKTINNQKNTEQINLFVLILLPVLIILNFWQLQQKNINYLEKQIDFLEKDINQPSTTKTDKLELKDKLTLKKDLLLIKKDRVNAQNALYVTLAQSIGGLFFLVTAYLTWRNVKATEENVKATEEKQVAERFSKAIELLQSDKPGVQLGGIYALERIAKDSKNYYWTIMEVLTAFVREPSDSQGALVFSVQEAVKVIGQLNSSQERKERSPSLKRANLTKGYFGNVNFKGFDLRDANFSDAILIGSNFDGAKLSGAIFDGADLSKANLSNVNLDEDETLKPISFVSSNLQGTDFPNALLIRSKFHHAVMNGANLSEAKLSFAKFNHAMLTSTNLRGADLNNAKFPGANLSGANLSGADLRGADLNNAKFLGANLSGADLSNSDLSGADLSNSDLSGADLTTAKNLQVAQIKSAQNWEKAKYNQEFAENLGLSS